MSLAFLLARMRASRRLALALVCVLVAGCGQASPGLTAEPSVGPLPTTAAATTAGAATPAPDPTATVSTVDGVAVTSISLGVSAAPIDVVGAFGSIWVALHRQGAVVRIDPETLEETARIKVRSGPGWFAVTDDAIWVTNQLARGLTRIDPATNTADVDVGDQAPCGGPVFAAGSIWQFACDAEAIMRIDPATNRAVDIPATGYLGVGQVSDKVVAVGAEAISRIRLDTNALERLAPGADGFPVLFDDSAVWLAAPGAIDRIRVADGKAVASLKVGGEAIITATGERAWVTENGVAVYAADLGAAEITRTFHFKSPTLAREIDGAVWVTSFDSNTLSRFEP